jgi:hypothetical protein
VKDGGDGDDDEFLDDVPPTQQVEVEVEAEENNAVLE